jgi:hypothetical protein
MNMNITKLQLGLFLPVVLVGLSGCENYIEGTMRYKGANSVIAIPSDRGSDEGSLQEGAGAIVYDPDGCQGWLIDDGLEGYSGRRFDPVSGLPVCNNLYPPGTVIGNYTTAKQGVRDSVPGVLANSNKAKP